MRILQNRNLLFVAFSLAFVVGCGEKSNADSPLVSESVFSGPMSEIRAGVFKLVSSGMPIEKIRFNTPENFRLLDTDKVGVFHPDGGSVPYKNISQTSLIESVFESEQTHWLFSGEIAIPMIFRHTTGRSSTDSEQLSEIIAYLPGIRKQVCEKINDSLGIKGIPKLKSDQSVLYEKEMIDSGDTDYVLPSGKQPYLDNPEFKGQPFGCFEDFSTGSFVYYHTIFER